MTPDPIMRWFTYKHLKSEEMQMASAPFCQLAEAIHYDYADTAQRALCLQLLLQAKDAAVRASVDKATQEQRDAIDARLERLQRPGESDEDYLKRVSS